MAGMVPMCNGLQHAQSLEFKSHYISVTAGSSPSTSSGGVYSGSGSATYYYDVKTMCPQDPNGYPENKGIPKCASNTPGPNQKSLKEVNSNNVVAMDNTVLSKDRAKYCGKEITIMHNGAKVNPPDGGSFYIWDGCAACIGGGRIDLSVSGARLVSSDACNRGVIPGVTWSVSDKQVKAFVAWFTQYFGHCSSF